MAALPPWAKSLFKYAGDAAWLAHELLFDDVYELNAADIGWTRVEFHYSRGVPTGYVEDRAITKLDLCSLDDSPLAGPLSAGERTTAAGILTTLFSTIMASTSNSHTLVERRWYEMHFRTPMTQQQRFADRGEPVQIDTPNVQGSLSTGGEAGFQMATSVTFKTPARRHWGRMYLPGLDSGNIDATGRISSAICDQFATAFQTAAEDLAADGTGIIVPSTQVGGVLTGALILAQSVQVDNVPDVIRRRRPKQTSYRKELP